MSVKCDYSHLSLSVLPHPRWPYIGTVRNTEVVGEQSEIIPYLVSWSANGTAIFKDGIEATLKIRDMELAPMIYGTAREYREHEECRDCWVNLICLFTFL